MLFRALPLLTRHRNVWARRMEVTRMTCRKSTFVPVLVGMSSEHMLPLRERSPADVAALIEVWGFYMRAQTLIASIGDSLELLDGGPSAKDLQRELDWLLEDCLCGMRHSAADSACPHELASASGGAGPPETSASNQGVDRFTASKTDATSPSLTPGEQGCVQECWVEADWRDLRRHLLQQAPGGSASNSPDQGAVVDHVEVQLRASLQDLDAMWRARVLERKPLQYITGAAFFRDLVLAVGPGVLIPRPETEQLVDLSVRAFQQLPQYLQQLPWVDVGTGTGAIACGLATSCEVRKVYAIDTSAEALHWAHTNVERLALQDRVQCLQGNLLEPLHALSLRGRLAGVVSNPPYIPSEDLQRLQAEVGRHEPWLALDGGPGAGTDILTIICMAALEYIADGGVLLLETNGGQQAHDLCATMLTLSCNLAPKSVHSSGSDSMAWDAQQRRARYSAAEVVADLFRVDRFIVASVVHECPGRE